MEEGLTPLRCFEKYFIWLTISCLSAMKVFTTSFSSLTILIAISYFYFSLLFEERAVAGLLVDDV